MLKIKIIAVGKCKEQWLKEAIAEYEKRLSSTLALTWVEVREAEIEPGGIALDPKGDSLDSVSFSQKLMSLFEKQGSKLSFSIGGPDGLSPLLLQKASFRWSLSPLTFTHQLTRLILVEQLYRALQIAKGSPYHK
jgi:23S rRNA (pseudouridine1915-N3)-methyltransferase